MIREEEEGSPLRRWLGYYYLEEPGLDQLDYGRGVDAILVRLHCEHIDDGLGIEGELLEDGLVVFQHGRLGLHWRREREREREEKRGDQEKRREERERQREGERERGRQNGDNYPTR